MNEQGIKEAVEQVQKWYDSSARMRVKEIKLLIDLAQQYLNVKGMPEEREKKFCNCDMVAEPASYCGCRIDNFNEALHLCKLAMMKQSQVSEEPQKSRDEKVREVLTNLLKLYLTGKKKEINILWTSYGERKVDDAISQLNTIYEQRIPNVEKR